MRRTTRWAVVSASGALLLAGCMSSPPPRLYVLNSLSPQAADGRQMALAARSEPLSGAASSPERASPATIGMIGVNQVNVPRYLDRSEIVVRRTANELQPLDNDRWAEPLGANATRALVENLTMLLPQYRVETLPVRASQRPKYEVALDITAFEVDEAGTALMAGQWSLIDSDSGAERAARRVKKAIPVGREASGDAIAAAMSRNLADVSAEIAEQIESLSKSRRTTAPRSTGSRKGRAG